MSRRRGALPCMLARHVRLSCRNCGCDEHASIGKAGHWAGVPDWSGRRGKHAHFVQCTGELLASAATESLSSRLPVTRPSDAMPTWPPDQNWWTTTNSATQASTLRQAARHVFHFNLSHAAGFLDGP